MRARVSDFLTGLLRRPEARLALVTHGIMSRVIIGQVLALTPDQTACIRHPNELFYRLEFHPRGVTSHHFLLGKGPFDGLLHHAD
jgi:broad specificity phosphatase PhoE